MWRDWVEETSNEPPIGDTINYLVNDGLSQLKAIGTPTINEKMNM